MASSVRVPQLHRGWMLTLYPGAGEGGGCFVSSRRREFRRGVVRLLIRSGRSWRRVVGLGVGCVGTVRRIGSTGWER